MLLKVDHRILELNDGIMIGEPSIQGFYLFLIALFYIGKGRKLRNLSHLEEARRIYLDFKSDCKIGPKHETLLNSFRSDNGIVVIQFFDSANSFEALSSFSYLIAFYPYKILATSQDPNTQ